MAPNTIPAAMSVAVDRKRFVRMLAINVVCVIVAIAAVIAAARTGNAALWSLFIGALAVGFAAQIWFIIAFARAGRGARS